MPIERDRYIPNYKDLHFQKKEAANWTCEFCDRICRKTGEGWSEFFDRVGWQQPLEEKWGRYILTVAHLNQKPEDNSVENLKALCAPCHLRHDRAFKVQNTYAKRERRGQLSLLNPQPLAEIVLAGHGVDPTRVQLPLTLLYKLG